MAKRLSVAVVGLLVLLLMGGAALAAGQGKATGCPGAQSLAGTTWTGDVTYAPADGTASSTESVTVSITAQNGKLITGSSTDPTGTAASIAFAGVLGSYGENCILMTAPEFVCFGALVRNHKTQKLVISGGSTAVGGGSFYGELTKQ